LRAEVDAYLKQLASADGPMPTDLGALRVAYAAGVEAAAEQFPAPPLAERAWTRCPTPAGDLRVLVQRPVETREAPVLVYFHGGGFAVAGPEATEFATAQLALAAGATVLSVDYRLAPENPYPAAFEDARAVLDWVREEAEEIGVDGGRIALGGDSSGGTLAAATALEAGRSGRAVDALLLFYPWLDMSLEGPSMVHLGPTDAVTPLPLLRAFRAAAFGETRAGWSRSDLLADDLSSLPETFIAVGGADPFLSDSERLAKRLREANVDFEYHRFEVQPHGFFTVPFLTDAHRVAALAGSFAASRLAAARSGKGVAA
jgi:acetyl esterase